MRTLVVFAALCAAAAAEELAAGPLTLEVEVSRTANLFHIVDNLSNWDRYAHAQYLRAFGEPSAEQAEMLRLHAAIRRKKGWGGGLEQTFYTTAPLADALAAGIEAGHVTAAEAERLERVLATFAPYADELFAAERARLEAFRARLQKQVPDLTAFARQVSRFCHGRSVRVPVYLIANPSDDSWGGGYNGGRLTLEVARKGDVYPTFLHELMHAFVNEERALLQGVVARTDGLDYTTLNEGIAYALSPGLFYDRTGLDVQVAADLEAGKPFDDPYVRFKRYGLALRPLLKEALDDDQATLTTFLPRARDAWRVVLELERARNRKRAGDPHRAQTFSAGPGWKTLGKRVGRLYSFNHSPGHYARILRRAAPGEKFVLMFALDDKDREVPEAYGDLMPQPWAEVEALLKAGKTVEKRGKARDLETVLLAAPTVAQLERLILATKLLAGPTRQGLEFFCIGAKTAEVYKALNNRMYKIHRRGVIGRGWAEALRHAQKGDLVFLLFDGERDVPKEHRDLLPVPLAELRNTPTLEAKGAARDLEIVLLAAPTEAELIALIARTKLLGERAEGRRGRAKFSLGGAYRALNQRLRGVTGRDHREKHYREILRRAREGDLLVIVFTPERGAEPTPAEYADLLPLKREEIDARVKRGETVEAAGEARGLKIVLLAAPTKAGLAELVATTKLLESP